MADDQGAVIIRDAEGTEHEFPAGFDPKRAAGIVRTRAHAGDVGPKTPADLYAGPTTYDEGYWKSIKDQGKALGRSALNALPGVGALVGGILSTPETLGAGTIPGAALGAGVGKGARDLIGHYTGLDAPSTPLVKAGGIAKEAAITGAVGAVLPGAVTALRTPVQTASELGEQFGSAMPPMIRRLGRLIPSVPKGAPASILQRPAWQTWESSAGPDLTRPVQAGSLTQAELAARAQAVREAGGLPTQQAVPTSTQPTVGQLRMAAGQGGPSGAGAIQPTPMSGTLRMAPPTEPPMGAGTPAASSVRAYKGGYPYDDAGKEITDFQSVGVRMPGAFEHYVGKKGGFAGFFSDDPAVASRFAGPQGAVHSVDIAKFENPLVIDAQGSSSANLQYGDMAKLPHEKAALMEMWDTLRGKNVGKYDGIILKNTKDEGTVYVPLKSSQVNHAFGQPAHINPTSLPTDWKTAVPDQVGHALDPARVDIGAQAAGRAAGLTKQQVRDVATPILDAAPGQASPILPEAALKRIVDTLKGLPKGGPEREAYVAKATSGKTQWQIENIRRTLEHLGLVVPAAVGGGALVREELMKRMRESSTPVS